MIDLNETLELNAYRIPYETSLKTMNNMSNIDIMGYSYSAAGLRFDFKNRSIGLLISGYFVPTGMFALFSLTSFLIDIKNVSNNPDSKEKASFH